MRRVYKVALVFIFAFISGVFISSCDQFKDPNYYEIIFKSNCSVDVDNIRVLAGKNADLPELEQVGYDFLGWYTSNSQDGVLFDENTRIYNDITLYAKWQIKTYTVTLANTNHKPLEIDYNQSFVPFFDLTKEGYLLEGWYFDEDFTLPYNTIEITRNLTIYAKWVSELDVVYVTLDYSNVGYSISHWVEKGSLAKLNDPIIHGYDFLGWYTSNGEDATLFDKDTIITEDITLYARLKVQTLTITYVFDDGTIIEPATFDYFTTATMPVIEGREDYIIDGWYLDTEYSQKYNFDSILHDNLTLYGRWLYELDYKYEFRPYIGGGYEITQFKDELATEAVIPASYHGETVVSIGPSAFSDRVKLTSITIPSSITTIKEDAFTNCSNLNSLIFEDNNTLEYIGDNAFAYCFKLATINIPNSVKYIGEYAFSRCDSLKEIFIPANVTTLGYKTFDQCQLLENIYVDENNQYYTSDDGVLYNNDYTILIKYPAAKKLTSYILNSKVTIIKSYSFSNTSNLESVILPESLTTIESFAFYRSGIKHITIPNSVTKIEESTFQSCLSLVSIDLPTNLQIIEKNAFSECNTLVNITIPSSVSFIGSRAFLLCARLQTIVFESTSQLKTIDSHAFSFCNSISSIVIPRSVTTIGDYIFNYCSNIEYIYVEYYNSKPEGWSDCWHYVIPINNVVWGYNG